MLSNLRLAVRTLSKTPFVTAIAIAVAGLGIGANTAIFSLFDRMLLRPLPVPDSGALVNLAAPGPKPGSNSCNQAGDCESVFSYPMFRDLERVQRCSPASPRTACSAPTWRRGGQTSSADGVLVSGRYFRRSALQPAPAGCSRPTTIARPERTPWWC